jgi:hypothetical protein
MLVGPGTARPLKPEIAFDTCASLCASRDFVHQRVRRLFHKYHLNDLMVYIKDSKISRLHPATRGKLHAETERPPLAVAYARQEWPRRFCL